MKYGGGREIDEIKAQIAENEDTIAKTNATLQEAQRLRLAEHAEWLVSDAEDKDMKQIVLNAKDVLTQFYADNNLMLLQGPESAGYTLLVQGPESAGKAGEAPPPPPTTWENPYGGQTEESTGVISILEIAAEDIHKDIVHAKANEDESESEFQAFKGESEQLVRDLTTATTNLEESQGQKEQVVYDTEESRNTGKQELKSFMTTIKDAEPGCDYLLINYPTRVKARQLEGDGLLKAKAILNGGAFDEPPKTFLQRRR